MRFTADGNHILVFFQDENVMKFSTANGERAFFTHVATKSAHAFVKDVLEWNDGSLVVARGCSYRTDINPCVMCIGMDGVTLEQMVMRSVSGDVLQPNSLCHSPLCNGVFVKCTDGSVFLLRDAWVRSSRCSWLGAACVE